MTSVELARLAVVAPQGLAQHRLFPPEPLLPAMPLTEATFDHRTVKTSFDGLFQHLRQERSLLAFARLLGLSYCWGQVEQNADTRFEHNLGRLPVLVVHSIPLDGQAGMVIGRPEGGSPNGRAWTGSELFVRATVSGRYSFFVL